MSKSLESHPSAKLSIENYLAAINKTPSCECFADLMYFLFDTWDFNAEIESKIIDITRLIAAMASTKVNNAIADELGNNFISNISHFLADLTKILMYMRDSEGCMAALNISYLDHATDVSDGFLARIKNEYEIRLQRLKDSEDF